MKKTIFIFPLLFYHSLYAQQEATISADHPTQSVGSSTVLKGGFLSESAFTFENTTSLINFSNFNSLLRFGISNKVELRVAANYGWVDNDGVMQSGFGPTNLGAKIFLLESKKSLPEISILGQINLPTGDFQSKTTGEIRLNFGNQFSEFFSLAYNIGMLVEPSNDRELVPFYTVALISNVYKGLSLFLEPYGFFGNVADQRVNGGLFYLIAPKFQLNFSGGYGISNTSPDSFFNIGASVGF